jgi:hypothetical protein
MSAPTTRSMSENATCATTSASLRSTRRRPPPGHRRLCPSPRHEIWPGRAQRRRETEREAGQERRREREEQRRASPVRRRDPHRSGARLIPAQEPGQPRVSSRATTAPPASATMTLSVSRSPPAGRGPPRWPGGPPSRAAGRRPGQQHVGQIRARDQQDQRRPPPAADQPRGRDRAVEVRVDGDGARGHDGDPLALVRSPGGRPRAGPRWLRTPLATCAVSTPGFGSGPSARGNAGPLLSSSESAAPPCSGGCPSGSTWSTIESGTHICTVTAGSIPPNRSGRHAHHRIDDAVHAERPPDDVRRGAEPRLPERRG